MKINSVSLACCSSAFVLSRFHLTAGQLAIHLHLTATTIPEECEAGKRGAVSASSRHGCWRDPISFRNPPSRRFATRPMKRGQANTLGLDIIPLATNRKSSRDLMPYEGVGILKSSSKASTSEMTVCYNLKAFRFSSSDSQL